MSFISELLKWKGSPVLPVAVGEFFARPSSYTVVPTGLATPTHIFFDDVIRDDLGIYDATNHLIVIPDDVVKIDCEYAVELASVASGFGSNAGTTRAMTMNLTSGTAITGLGALSCSRVGMDGGAYSRMAISVPMSLDAFPSGWGRDIKPQFRQDSGVDIRIGDSSGTGAAQTFVKMRLYRAL